MSHQTKYIFHQCTKCGHREKVKADYIELSREQVNDIHNSLGGGMKQKIATELQISNQAFSGYLAIKRNSDFARMPEFVYDKIQEVVNKRKAA